MKNKQEILKKICNTCHEERLISSFSKHKGTRDGYTNMCNPCFNVNHKRLYKENKVKYRESARKNREAKKEKYSLKDKEYYEKNKEKKIAYQKEYKKKHKLKQAAVARVRYAVKTGKLLKPIACSEAKFTLGIGCKGEIQGHHYAGYDYENALKVEWFCRKHHMDEHKRLRDEKDKQQALQL